MKPTLSLDDLRAALRAHPGRAVTLALPDGRRVPAEFHVTEAGTVTKDSIDCGGTRRRRVTAQLQTWTGRDAAHRLSTDRLARILEVCGPVLPAGDTPVEVEYEDGVVSQYPLAGIAAHETSLRLELGLRHTDGLARERCGEGDDESVAAACGCGEQCC
jgi:hypothetical protein